MNKIEIELQGRLEPIEVDVKFADLIDNMNIAMGQGKGIVIIDDADGNKVGFALHNLLTIRELEDDDAFVG